MSSVWTQSPGAGAHLLEHTTRFTRKSHKCRKTDIYAVDRVNSLKKPPRIWESRYQAGLDTAPGVVLRPARPVGSRSCAERRRKKLVKSANRALANKLKAVKNQTIKKCVLWESGVCQLDKFQKSCIDNFAPEIDTEDLSATKLKLRMKKQYKLRRENRKHVAAMINVKSFYDRNEMAKHEANHRKRQNVVSRGGLQTTEFLGRKNHKTMKSKRYLKKNHKSSSLRTHKGQAKSAFSFKDLLHASYTVADEPTGKLEFQKHWAKDPPISFKPLVNEYNGEIDVIQDETFTSSWSNRGGFIDDNLF